MYQFCFVFELSDIAVIESEKIKHRVLRQKQLLLVKVPCYNAMVGGLSYTQIKDIFYIYA